MCGFDGGKREGNTYIKGYQRLAILDMQINLVLIRRRDRLLFLDGVLGPWTGLVLVSPIASAKVFLCTECGQGR